jgi:hypothetical protein
LKTFLITIELKGYRTYEVPASSAGEAISVWNTSAHPLVDEDWEYAELIKIEKVDDDDDDEGN